jgi:AcrR family transcriptional regulator
MQAMREWLLKTVVYELTLKGIHGINLKQMATAGGMSADLIHERFPDKRSLMFALIDEICQTQKDYIEQHSQGLNSPKERLIQFILTSFEFIEKNPGLADVIVLALLGSDPEVKERVYDAYGKLFMLTHDDMIAEEIIPNKSRPLLLDLSEILLSVMFLGGAPGLQMDYLSFVDPYKVSLSTLNAIKKRYSVNRF